MRKIQWVFVNKDFIKVLKDRPHLCGRSFLYPEKDLREAERKDGPREDGCRLLELFPKTHKNFFKRASIEFTKQRKYAILISTSALQPYGQLTQWESVFLTWRKSGVRIPHCPPEIVPFCRYYFYFLGKGGRAERQTSFVCPSFCRPQTFQITARFTKRP